MALKFECDGCGRHEQAPAPNNLPSNWTNVEVRGLWTAVERQSMAFHLCRTCARELEGKMPDRWPRAKAEPA